MPEAAPRARNCPIFIHSDVRYALVAESVTDEWQTAADIAAKIREVPEDVRYQLNRLRRDGKVERREEMNKQGRRRLAYRAVR